MTIEFFTGFEGCASTNDARALFNTSAVFSLSSTTGWNSSKAIVGSNNTGWYARKSVSPAKTKVIGFHASGFQTYGYSTTEAIMLCRFIGPDIRIFNASSGLQVYRGSTYLGACNTIITSNLTHIEVKCFSDASVGTVQIKVNGTIVLDLSELNTSGNDITTCGWGCTYTSNARLDNLFIADDWQGELISLLVNPIADDSVQFTPSSGIDNYALIETQDGDTSYVESSTVGHKDLYEYDNIPAGYTIKAMTLVTIPKKDDAGLRTLQAISEQDSTEYDIGDEVTLSLTYPAAANEGMLKTESLAPDGTTWSNTKFNSCKFGFKIAS